MGLTQSNAGLSEEFLTEGTLALIATCADVTRAKIAYGPNLLRNGDFSETISLVVGPGWKTDYFFDNIGGVSHMVWQPTGGPDGGPAVYVDISTNLTSRIFYWTNVYLENGAVYDVGMSLKWSGFAAQMNVAIRIDGGAPLVTLLGNLANTWAAVVGSFTFTGVTGYHTVAVTSNSAAGNGNDGTFDNIYLRKTSKAVFGATINVNYGAILRALVDQIVKIAGCNDDRRDQILADISTSVMTTVATTEVDSHAIAIGGVAAVAQTVSALLPAGKRWIAISFTVLAGTANLTDFDGTVHSNLPVGYKAYWEAPAIGGILSPPRTITANANSRVAISFTVKN